MSKLEPGKRYGRLVVEGFSGYHTQPSGKRKSRYQCRCDCGNDAIIIGSSLTSGNSRSCGCLRRDVARDAHIKHGNARTGTRSGAYKKWTDMLGRCYRPKHTSFKNYGARGINVCARWRKFENFLADMGYPEPGMTLDRIKSNGNYQKSNCRWSDMLTQQNNRRNNVIVTLRGRRMTAAQLARLAGLPQWKVQDRLRRGFTPEQAISHARRLKR